MGRHHQRAARRSVLSAHLALGAAVLATTTGATGTALALDAPVAIPAAAPVVVNATARPAADTTVHRATTSKATPICDLSGPPVFGDPEHPDVITNRACGYVDAHGRQRSRDPWIDGQLAGATH